LKHSLYKKKISDNIPNFNGLPKVTTISWLGLLKVRAEQNLKL